MVVEVKVVMVELKGGACGIVDVDRFMTPMARVHFFMDSEITTYREGSIVDHRSEDGWIVDKWSETGGV